MSIIPTALSQTCWRLFNPTAASLIQAIVTSHPAGPREHPHAPFNLLSTLNQMITVIMPTVRRGSTALRTAIRMFLSAARVLLPSAPSPSIFPSAPPLAPAPPPASFWVSQGITSPSHVQSESFPKQCPPLGGCLHSDSSWSSPSYASGLSPKPFLQTR